MKKILLLLLLAPLCSISQIVSIPDSAFKTFLISNGVDTNGDGNIQQSEALAITSLNIVGQTLIASFEGLEAFENLETLTIHSSAVETLNIQGFNYLEDLTLTGIFASDHTSISNLPALWRLTFNSTHNGQILEMHDLPSLIQLSISSHYHTLDYDFNLAEFTTLMYLLIDIKQSLSLDFSALPVFNWLNLTSGGLDFLDLSGTNLDYLEINCRSNGYLPNIDLSGLPVRIVDISGPVPYNNNLTGIEINLSGCDTLDMFSITDYKVTAINFEGCTGIADVNISGHQVTSLDLSDCFSLSSLSLISNYPTLESLNIKNGSQESLAISGVSESLIVCADAGDWSALQNVIPEHFATTYCTFTPGGSYNTITGNIRFDSSSEGCDSAATVLSPIGVMIDDGTNQTEAFISSNGNYLAHIQTESATVTPVFENDYFTAVPQTVTFDEVNYLTQTVDFCVTPNGVHPDLEIVLTPLNAPNPGFDNSYNLIVRNKGNQTLSGAAVFNYDEAIYDFVESGITPTATASGQLQFGYNLAPFQTSATHITLNLNSPTETPPVNIDDIVTVSASAFVANDETPSDNEFTLTQTVVGSFDPNDKTCLEGTTVSASKIGDYLHYLIRFENTGTAPAQNVVVADAIDATKFDISSIQILDLSHDGYARMADDKLEVIFEGINLPFDDENNDGYVLFKIKTKNTLADGDSVSNSASIYFDYNFPIVTEPAVTTFSSLSVVHHTASTLTLYPNPGRDQLSIASSAMIDSYEILDASGRKVLGGKLSTDQSFIDVSSLASGIYLVKAKSGEGSLVAKWVKE
jgi:hypothetical protein